LYLEAILSILLSIEVRPGPKPDRRF